MDPALSRIDEVCREMTDLAFELVQVSPLQGEGGSTVGLWLFFSPVRALRPIPSEAQEGQPAYSWMSWIAETREKKGLGISLVVTGAWAVIIGIILHFALRNNIIETSLHLGYYFGVFGLIVFLIGLLIVF
jgi:hypothetical protein